MTDYYIQKKEAQSKFEKAVHNLKLGDITKYHNEVCDIYRRQLADKDIELYSKQKRIRYSNDMLKHVLSQGNELITETKQKIAESQSRDTYARNMLRKATSNRYANLFTMLGFGIWLGSVSSAIIDYFMGTIPLYAIGFMGIFSGIPVILFIMWIQFVDG